MASEAEILSRYKLDTVFYHNAVVHITYRSDQLEEWRRVDTKVRWENDGDLGAGAFGVVSRQRQEGSGKLRAVKTISKRQMNIREVEAMVELQDVCSTTLLHLHIPNVHPASGSFRDFPWLVRRPTCHSYRNGIHCAWRSWELHQGGSREGNVRGGGHNLSDFSRARGAPRERYLPS